MSTSLEVHTRKGGAIELVERTFCVDVDRRTIATMTLHEAIALREELDKAITEARSKIKVKVSLIPGVEQNISLDQLEALHRQTSSLMAMHGPRPAPAAGQRAIDLGGAADD